MLSMEYEGAILPEWVALALGLYWLGLLDFTIGDEVWDSMLSALVFRIMR